MSARSLVLAASVVLSATACASDGVTAPVAPPPQMSIREVLAERAAGIRAGAPVVPGAPMRIRICGFTGERMVGRPLFLVDGAVVQHTIAHGLDPRQIESIHVLRGPQAVEIYGPEARDGAIIVRTKAGAAAAAAPGPAAR